MDSIGGWTVAIDPVDPDVITVPAPQPHGFAAGLFAGILVAAIAGQFWLAQHLEALALFVDDVQLRSLSKLAVSPLWRYGIPSGFGAVVVTLLGLRVRATAVWVILAAAAVLTLVLTHIWALSALD